MNAPQPRLWLNPPLFPVLSCNAMEVRPQGADTILIVDDDELVRKSAATLIAMSLLTVAIAGIPSGGR